MTREEIFTALDQVFQEEFDDDTIHVTEKTVADDIEDWDSLEHINLIVAIEKRFHMHFTMGEVTGMKNVGEMVDILLQRAK
jgi:acyl carrier protein